MFYLRFAYFDRQETLLFYDDETENLIRSVSDYLGFMKPRAELQILKVSGPDEE